MCRSIVGHIYLPTVLTAARTVAVADQEGVAVPTTNGLGQRSQAVQRLAGEVFDVLVVGGGIVGAGVALDAASRGLRTALVDKGDFASGTSSQSSKLVHGGLRYLEQREFRLVYEALAERSRLLKIAPHLVFLQPFVYPIFASGEGSGRMAAAKTLARGVNTALWGYDLTGSARIGKFHKKITPDEVLEYLPDLDPTLLAAGFEFHDARVDDARLVLTILRTAAESYGAAIANYAEVVGIERVGSTDRVTGASIRDAETGNVISVRASCIVNAAGVWTDEIRTMDEGVDPDSVRPAKGVHIAVAANKVIARRAGIIPVPGEKRFIFVIPWGEHVFFGTTDTDYTGSVEDVVCTEEDAQYLINTVNAWFSSKIGFEDVTGTWAGIRPLIKAAKNAKTADLSRRHSVTTSESGVVSVTGGKLTTYRKMAKDTVDAVYPVIGAKKAKSITKSVVLSGGEGWDAYKGVSGSSRMGVTVEVADHLASRYGNHAMEVAQIAQDPTLAGHLCASLPYIRAEVVYAVRFEMARTVIDVLSRRTRSLLLERDEAMGAAQSVAALMAAELGWDSDEIVAQVDAFIALAEHERDALPAL